MKPLPGINIGPEEFAYDEDSRELLEGMEGASVAEKLVDTDFFNNFEVSLGISRLGWQVGRHYGCMEGQLCCCVMGFVQLTVTAPTNFLAAFCTHAACFAAHSMTSRSGRCMKYQRTM